LIVVGLLATSMLCSGYWSMWSMLLVALFNSIMFPGIFTLGIAKLGPLTSRASGLLMSAAVGGAIIPVLQGAVADHIGIQRAFIISLLCYLYVGFYAFKGFKPLSAVM
jgi:MFS transporter, FHS family, L-fucose permease